MEWKFYKVPFEDEKKEVRFTKLHQFLKSNKLDAKVLILGKLDQNNFLVYVFADSKVHEKISQYFQQVTK